MFNNALEFKYFYAWHAAGNNNSANLNKFLEEGWQPVRETPFGGAGGGENVHSEFLAIVLLARVKTNEVEIG